MTDIKPHWYSLAREGMATLCVDGEDARANAAHCDQAWPNGAPHRAVQLVPAADVAALVRQALDALTYQGTMGPTRRQRRHAAIKALDDFLAQQEAQKP